MKRKVDTSINNKTVIAAPLNKKNCRVCCDHFKEPLGVYSTHHANSSKCPHFTTSDRKSPHEPKSGDDILTDNNDILTDNNDKELLVSNSDCTSVEVDNDKLINLSTIIKSEANGDSSDDHSAYIINDNYDSDNVTFERKCKEPIFPADVIKYYYPIFVAGDPPGLRETSVLAVDPNYNFPLVLSNGEGLCSTTMVKRIKVIQHNRLIDHRGIFWAIDQFLLKKRHSATAADEVYMQAGCFEGSMKKHIIKGMGKAKANGFAPGDMLVNKFSGSDTVSAAANLLMTIKSKKHPLSEDTTIDDYSSLNTREYVYPHKTEAEAINILRHYGTVRDVPGDGSCGYHCMMLLLHRMKLIDNTLSVTQFCRGIHEFIESNMSKFVGVSLDGNDAVFQYPWGQISPPKKKSCNPAASWTRFMTTAVMSGIWSNRVDYSSPVSKAHWMDSGYLFPVIAYKYQIRQLVLYDNSGTHAKSVNGGHCFTAYVYCYDKSTCSISTNTIPGLVHDIGASGNACMVFFCKQSYFMLFEYFDLCS